MTGQEILQKHPTGREYAHLLQGKKKYPIFVDSNNKILSMPPIINSQDMGKITQDTRDIFIECSGHNLNILKKTLNILITMFAEMKGEIYQMKINYKKPEITPDLQPEKMKINLDNINNLLGLNLKEQEFKNLVEKMGHDYKNSHVLIPAWRTDILHEVDIAEDVAIAYGYDKIIPEIPKISTIANENKKEQLKRKISNILIGLNMLETSTYHLISKQDLKKSNQTSKIEVEKSKTDYTHLRQNLFISILKVLGENVDAEYPQRIFEIGKIFKENDKEETTIQEKEHLITAQTPSNFTEIKQILKYLEKMLNLKFQIEETIKQGFINGRTAKIILNKKEIGIFGEINPTILKNWHIKMPLAILEINLEEIFKIFNP
jgi:phenylalanyl-tRNA synthetase beta chain